MNSNKSIRASKVQEFTCRVPSEGIEFVNLSFFSLNSDKRFLVGAGDIPNHSCLITRSSYPLVIRIESQIVNGRTGLISNQRLIEVLQLPYLYNSILASSTDINTVGVDGKSVDGGIMSSDADLQSKELTPDLQSVIPSNRSIVVILQTWRVSNSGDTVFVVLYLRYSLQVSFVIPKVQFLLETARKDLS
jgi:hypothetical protein